ncbi:hypothetical protein CEY16_07465 [Halalkalibacillus sediminis]|uniref:Uncharacterized protein n=1 Tax=Halalkalibacillus sediminis TaxID=2018042 RepID=A0A2I0QTU4_9BACI|nr:hypothetical protein [Halalkalibacillus sediminis]PKR77761.1 hypothetical protein CEY16_07465 [Halalkalibacillus sediminis]
MNKFTKWFIVSISLALIGLIIVFNVEEWARLSGEMNRNILLFGTLSTFILVLSSFYFLFKANFERVKAKIVISLFSSLFPITVFIMNGLMFTIYFIGK